jgi:hypothetical protein
MPIVEALGSKFLKSDPHWIQIIEVMELDHTFEIEKKEFKLGDLIKLGVAQYQDQVCSIATTAR